MWFDILNQSSKLELLKKHISNLLWKCCHANATWCFVAVLVAQPGLNKAVWSVLGLKRSSVMVTLCLQIWSMWSGSSAWWRRGTGTCGWSLCAWRSPTRLQKTSTCGCWLTTPVTSSISWTSWSFSHGCSLSEAATSWSVNQKHNHLSSLIFTSCLSTNTNSVCKLVIPVWQEGHEGALHDHWEVQGKNTALQNKERMF